MVKLRINMRQGSDLKCENCGVELKEDNIYVRLINGQDHYFCCSHCADKYESRLGNLDGDGCCSL
ncbi:transcriptional regulator [Sulfolobus sp. E1]|nr:transcriptional regulator [Sulfolobus sp. E5]TRM75196.1 transcriptional regulator [Sulfolobus sp. A20-N-F8]TRM79648.1 transcriptional regulator [Sulfolobus sp. B5]TRM80210.1 transcriptional regulator [Sulfolobus sp. D5]TRM84433.1 transcriptional regulator [Sulfolobus sp. F3]TRM88372.1 transcriptional regulator [Sulfolobus sp. E3]TRM89347.1 transcriptional regulator [Sulfolobus sp. C3]TRM89496.1 transcriptional regulator [Sulfolobus sp. A20-N-G8]TRN00505.1 transcriptional regulator [Sulfo